MGTPEFAVAGLEALLENNYNIVGVITAPDRPAGRGQKLKKSAVKQFAEQKELTILQPTNLKDPIFLEQLKELKANLQVVAFRMLPKVVWQMPEYGTFNLHASLLPQYRGAAPINWAIINGEKETGVTTFFIDEKIDTGAIILQEKITIQEDENAGSLHDRLMVLGATLIKNTVQLIADKTPEITIQKEATALKSAPKIFKDTCQIDWEEDMGSVYNKIRGLSPYPAAWTTLYNGEQSITLKIFKTKKHSNEHKHKVGKVIMEEKKMKIFLF